MKWTIKTRLIAGCALLLVVIAAACAYGLRQMSSAETSIGDITRRSEVNIKRLEAAHDAKEGLLAAQRFDADFRLSKQLKSMEEVHKSLQEARDQLKVITASAAAGDALIAPV